MTLQDLFPDTRKKSIGVASAITMPSHLTRTDHWADTKSGLTVDSVAKAHTAIQLYAIRATAKPNNISKGIWRNHAHQLTLLHPDRYLRYCPCCAQEQIKVYGGDNDLLRRIEEDPAFGLTAAELEELAHPAAFTGMAGSQCTRYLDDVIKPILEQNQAEIQSADEINV